MNFHFVSFFLLLFHIHLCLKGKSCRYLLDLMVELNNPSFMINLRQCSDSIQVRKKMKLKKLTKWLVHFMCCAGNVKNTSGSGVWRNDRGQCKYFHRTTSNDIWWYLTDVRHGSEMRYNRRQKTILYELSSGYMYIRKKKPTCHWWTKALSENTTHDSQIYLRIFFLMVT